ncbi:hypothetical protein ASE88_15320 [Sphingomonas sp. Leaf38]|nr:hypothetical protein ASE88_15320 [Sphingomonas sp. Leaf38]
MRSAIWVLNIFATIWGAIGLAGVGWPARAVPMVISVLLITWASRIPAPERTAADSKRIGRLIGTWTMVEGVAIFATFALTPKLGVPDAAVPILAIVVGLHFLPIARGIPMPVYYATGLAMIATGAVALLLPGAVRYAATGLPCAIILWASCVAIGQRARRRVLV